MYNNYKMGYNVVDFVTSYDEFIKIYNEKYIGKIDEVIKTDVNHNDENLKFLDFCEQNHIIFKYVADLFDSRFSNIGLDTLAGIPVIEILKTKLDGWGRIIKRAFDIVSASFCIVIFSPIMIIVFILIKLDSKVPIIYKNKRRG